jgi:hypothetical protein
LTALFLLLAVTSIFLFLFSPWHVHNRLSLQPCAFVNLEHGAWSEGLAQPITFDPPAILFVPYDVPQSVEISEPATIPVSHVRAPPLFPNA